MAYLVGLSLEEQTAAALSTSEADFLVPPRSVARRLVLIDPLPPHPHAFEMKQQSESLQAVAVGLLQLTGAETPEDEVCMHAFSMRD
jgi:hypothetical protein